MDKTNEMNETNDTEEPEPLLKNERIMPVAAKVSSGARNRTRCPCVNAPAAWRAAMRQVMDVRGGGGRQRGGAWAHGTIRTRAGVGVREPSRCVVKCTAVWAGQV